MAMKRLTTLICVVGALVGVFYLVGMILPRSRATGSKTTMDSKTTEVYQAIVDLRGWPRWFPGVTRAEEGAERAGHPTWRLTDDKGEMFDLEVTSEDGSSVWIGVFERRGSRFTLRFDVKWFGEGASVFVTEQADTRSPWMRARRFFMNEHTSMPGILLALGKQLGDAVEPKDF